jgi:predicted MFS family arabinose efflux permease
LASYLGRGRLLGWSLVLFPATLVVYSTAQAPWWGAAALFAVGMVYIGVLSGLSTLVQLRAPQAYRGRVLSFFLVALGVAYPLGSLVQGPIIDRVGIGWTTAGSALLLVLIMAGASLAWPGIRRAVTSTAESDPAGPAADVIPANPQEDGCAEPGQPDGSRV